MFFKKLYPKIKRLKIPLLNVYFGEELVKKKTPPLDDETFGVYCFCGKQGYGKTYFAVRWIYGWFDPSEWKIITNLKSVNLPGSTYVSDLDKILMNRDKKVVILVDEIFKKIEDNPRYIRKVTEWLAQSRKHQRVVIFTTQEWKLLDHRVRWFVKRSIDVSPWFFGWRRLVWGDAENMTYDKLKSDFDCPVVSVEYSKFVPKITNLYDTKEAIE